MRSSLQFLSLLLGISQSVVGALADSQASPKADSYPNPYPVSCDGIAYGVGNITISSVQDTSVQFDVLQSGPGVDVFGRPFLEQGSDPDFPIISFLPCNSSYMNYKSYDFNANQTLVAFYG